MHVPVCLCVEVRLLSVLTYACACMFVCINVYAISVDMSLSCCYNIMLFLTTYKGRKPLQTMIKLQRFPTECSLWIYFTRQIQQVSYYVVLTWDSFYF